MGGVELINIAHKYGALAGRCNLPVILKAAQINQQPSLQKLCLLVQHC